MEDNEYVKIESKDLAEDSSNGERPSFIVSTVHVIIGNMFN